MSTDDPQFLEPSGSGQELVDRCEGCPIGELLGNQPCLRADCHLTDRDKTIIDAMIRGVFDCGHCEDFDDGWCCDLADYVVVTQWPCEDWKERKEAGND